MWKEGIATAWQKRHDISDFCGYLGTFTTIHVFEKWQSRATTVNENLL